MVSMIRAFAGAALAIGLCVAQAEAEITTELYSSFAAAYETDDAEAKRSAAESMAAAAMDQPEHPQAALIAFEAAWGFCRIEDCESGRDAAAFALQQPPTDGYPVMGEREMLMAYIDWRTNPKRATRRALDDALEVVERLPASTVSLSIFTMRMQADVNKKDWLDLRESAGSMARHLEPVNAVLPHFWAQASLNEQIADFNRNQERRVEPRLAHLQGKLALALEQADPALIETVEDTRWRIEAWRTAINAYFLSKPGERPTPESSINAILEQYPDHPNPPGEESDSSDQDERPFCDGSFDMTPPIRYSGRQARRGRFGSVYARLSVEDGLVSDVEILASVPLEEFRDQASKAIAQWRWIAADDQPEPDCKMSYSNIVLPIIFSLD